MNSAADMHLLTCRFTGDEARVELFGASDAAATVRVVTEPAPGRGWEQSVELLGVEGRPNRVRARRVAQWVEQHRDLLCELHGEAVRS